MKKGFIFLTILLIICGAVVSLTVMSENISNMISLIPNESAPDSDNDHRININTAKIEQLTLLPGIGEELAVRIIEYREKHGNFRYLEELGNVKGIGYDTLNIISPMITVGG